MGELRPIGLFAFSCLIACLTQALPTWLIFFSIIGIGWKFWRGPRMPTALLVALMILSWSLLIFDSPKFLHRDSLTGALVLGSLFSILSPPHQQRVMRFHVGLFALLVSILIIPKETFPLWLYFGLSLLICISLVLHHLPNQSMFSLLNLGRSLIKLALPLVLCLLPVYYFFPEIRSPNQTQGMSGMSGDLEPGQLAKLALSDRLAFRVRFLSDVPAKSQLYWRAEVLEKSRGMSWTQGFSYNSRPFLATARSQPIVYELMLDSQLNGLLPLLEQSTSLSPARDASPLLWQAEKNIVHTSNRFLLAGATPSSSFQALTAPKLDRPDLQLSPRVAALVDALKAREPKEQIRLLMNRFRGYQYSLKPGRLHGKDPLDEFLFETKTGFCEHFAASFSTLLRLAGTPARIVIGYQGAHRLGSSSYYQITNADAHAWSEVWIDGRWLRVDPSSVVLSAEGREAEEEGLSSLVMAWLSFTMQHAIDLMQDWSDDIGAFWMSLGICAAGLILIQIYRLRRKKDPTPRWERNINKFLLSLESRAPRKGASETVYNYLERMGGDYGIAEFRELATLYNLSKFAEEADAVHRLEACLARSRARLPELRRRERSRKDVAA